jgi:hypothetical protein
MMEAQLFSHWLSKQKPLIGILPSHISSIRVEILPTLDNGDLIVVLTHGDDQKALSALKLLRLRFEDEMNFLEEMSRENHRD